MADEHLDRVDALRRLTARLKNGELGLDGVWFADCVGRYLNRAHEGLTLGAACELEPGAWWLIERRSRRNEALREFAQRFLPETKSTRARASELASALRRYETSQWRRDKRSGLPCGMEFTPRGILFRVCSASAEAGAADTPTSVRHFERILSGCSN